MSNGNMRPSRFAHLEGHTDICYSDDGRHIITCGLDGDIRLFKGLDDDDCITHTIADQVHCVAFKDGSILAGTNLNIVQSYTFDEGEPNGIITRCTAYPTHVTVSNDKNLVAVASSDMTIKVHDTEHFQDLLFTGHEAPVLSVALDPQRDFLATSSCDGTVCIWNYRTQTVVRSFPLFPKSNDFAFSSTLCRLIWSLDGQYLIVPVNSELQIFNRNNWKVEFTLSHSSITGAGSVATLSPCGNYVALGCRDGRVTIWDLKKKNCIASEKSSKGMAITGLVWHPKGKEELAFVNGKGELGTMENFLQEPVVPVTSKTLQEKSAPCEEGASEEVFPPFDVEEEEDGEISIAKIKSDLGFADDEEGTFLGTKKTPGEESRPPSRMDTPLPASVPQVIAPKLPEPQKPFQPSMSPEHHSDRYMVWNSTGIVLQYQSEDEQSIEVEFHDSSVHHALHLNNPLGCTMATLNNQALALAAESQEDSLSKLLVHHFSSWDGGKEWQTEMPEGEDILAVGIGNGWVAVATDLRILRIFSTAGTQKEVISIPGPVVCLAGFEKNVMVIFHSGIGVCGEQSMSVMILSTSGRRSLVPTPVPIPLSPKSFLMWAGFTDEGTPMIMDSVGVIRLLSKTSTFNWTPVLNTKAHAKGKSDYYFLLGASEVQGMVRCILCKGSRHPPVVPRPHVSLLNLKVPLCEPETEKSCLEETAIRAKLLSSTVKTLTQEGFDVEIPQFEVNKSIKESLVKLFALACRSDRESRGVEICEWMPTPDMVEVAIKYAAKLSRMQLAERLNKVVQQKVEEHEESELMDEALINRHRAELVRKDLPEREPTPPPSISIEADNPRTTEDIIKSNPLLAAACKHSSSNDSTYNRITLTPTTRNPFKKEAEPSTGGKRAMQVLDSLKIVKEKETAPVLRPFMKKIKPKAGNSAASVKHFAAPAPQAGKENIAGAAQATQPCPGGKRSSALKLWLEDNRVTVAERFPSATEAELLVKAALIFKDIEDSVKQKYKMLAAATPLNLSSDEKKPEENADERKRKSDSTAGQPMEKKTKSVGSKLAGFAFAKKVDEQ